MIAVYLFYIGALVLAIQGHVASILSVFLIFIILCVNLILTAKNEYAEYKGVINE